MTKKRIHAAWRSVLYDNERRELELVEKARDATAENLRELTKRLKSRCLKRIKRNADQG